MHLGFGQLRLSSTDFWGMTPSEIARCIPPQKLRPDVDLKHLMQLYPDTPDAEEPPDDQ